MATASALGSASSASNGNAKVNENINMAKYQAWRHAANIALRAARISTTTRSRGMRARVAARCAAHLFVRAARHTRYRRAATPRWRDTESGNKQMA